MISDIQFAQAQVRTFAQHQREALRDIEVETLPGVILGHKNLPVTSVGCYIPGGRYPMVASAAHERGHGQGRRRETDRGLHAANGWRTTGGYGRRDGRWVVPTRSISWVAFRRSARWRSAPVIIPSVDMIVGPGNAYVAEAKRQLFGRVGIDLLAGPTEVLVIADETSDAEICATDLLGQAEHGPTSPAILLTTQRGDGSRHHPGGRSPAPDPCRPPMWPGWPGVTTGEVIVCESDDGNDTGRRSDRLRACGSADARAALLSRPADELWRAVPGPRTNVAYGDKVIGTNHTLPTTQRQPLHWRPVGRQVPQDGHLPGGADRRGERDGRRIRFAAVRDRALCRPSGSVRSPGSALWFGRRGGAHTGVAYECRKAFTVLILCGLLMLYAR